MRRLPVIVALFAVAVAAPRSTAQVITFDSLSGPNTQTLPSSYTESGFTLVPGTGATGKFGSYGTSDPNYAGSAALYHQDPNGTITLTQVGGGVFNLTSIDVAELFANGPTPLNEPLTFTGNKAAGGTVTANFTLDGTFGTSPFQTFTFTDFTDLTSVTWSQENLAGTTPGQFHQFDNIVVAPVPEPATALGFAALCGGALGLVRRYRRRTAVIG